ncbi:MAG: polysaccharide pyruvyl transferase family protein [Ancalomicrobiaceae bacterium]|nr:polysaccharide pyruvyl transferase family protein [Ancalomicrobiaceae bacterium]
MADRPYPSADAAPSVPLGAADGEPLRDRVRVAIFNVKYSPNLGDGLLSECLEAELARWLPGASIEVLDLAGRSDYGLGRLFIRTSSLALLHHSPTPVRHLLAETALRYKLWSGLRHRWRQALTRVDAVIVGGGNLLSDADLNFPLKLDAAMAEVRAADVPAGVFAVGASDNWSARGEKLFRRAFSGTDLYFASTREPRSAEIWRRRLGPTGVAAAEIVHDPAQLSSLHFQRGEREDRARPLIGLGLVHPIALKYHADERNVSSDSQVNWYVALARACVARGWDLVAFTNGSPEDELFLAQMRPALTAASSEGSISFLPRASKPSELARFISTLDLLMAHRLHANIAAYSYAIPQIGFTWDIKLKTFLAHIGRGNCVCTVGVDAIDTVVNLAAWQLASGVDPVRHGTVIAQAQSDVAHLSHALINAVRRARTDLAE